MNARVSVAGGARTAVVVILVVAYPFLIAGGLDLTSARTLGGLLLAATMAAVVAAGGGKSRLLRLALRRFGLLVAVAVVAAATNHPVALTLLPSATSLWLLATFAATLRTEPSIVGQFATAAHGDFPDFLLPYCRRVTVVWCVFFACNAAASLVLAVTASTHAWAFYTGFLSYVLIGALGAGEYLFHKFRFRFYEDSWVDGLWRRFFPPERTALGRRTLAWQQARRGASHAKNPR